MSVFNVSYFLFGDFTVSTVIADSEQEACDIINEHPDVSTIAGCEEYTKKGIILTKYQD